MPEDAGVGVVIAGPDRAADVLALIIAQFDDHSLPWEEGPLRSAVRAVLADPSLGRFLLAERDGETIGLANLAYTFTLEVAGRAAWLDELYVRPEHRGHGIGARLLRKAIELARAEGCRSMELEVERGHERVVSLYRRHRFRARERSRWWLDLEGDPEG